MSAATAAAPQRALLYCRVSTEEQAEHGTSMAGQETDLRAYCKTNHLTVAGVFPDPGFSGGTLDRPGLDRLRDAVKATQGDVVLVTASDRLSREVFDALLLQREFKQAGVSLRYLNRTVEDSPYGEFTDLIFNGVGQLEKHVISRRMSKGRRDRAKQGVRPGGLVPFGYACVHEPDGSKRGWRISPKDGGLRIVEAEAELIRRMYSWTLDGDSVRTIAMRLRAQGHVTRQGKPWPRSSVARVLQNPIYRGETTFNRQEFRRQEVLDQHGRLRSRQKRVGVRPASEWITNIKTPAIVTESVWHRAQAAMQRHRTTHVGRPGSRTFILRGLLECGGCGRKWHGTHQRTRKNGTRPPVYRCRGYIDVDLPPEDRCTVSYQPAVRLETAVQDALRTFWRNPEAMRAAVRRSAQALGSARLDHQTTATDVRKRLAQVERQLADLIDLYTSKVFDRATIEAKATPLKRQADDLKAQLATSAQRVTQGTADLSQHQAILRDSTAALAGLDRGDDRWWQRHLRQVVTKVVVHRTRVVVHGTLDLAPDLPAPKGRKGRQVTDLDRDAYRPECSSNQTNRTPPAWMLAVSLKAMGRTGLRACDGGA